MKKFMTLIIAFLIMFSFTFANAQVKTDPINPSIDKTVLQKDKKEEKKEMKKEHKREKKEMRKEHKKEMKDMKKEHKQERKGTHQKEQTPA